MTAEHHNDEDSRCQIKAEHQSGQAVESAETGLPMVKAIAPNAPIGAT
jgi:hypothetical protein